MTGHSTSQVKGMLWPRSIDPNYQEFKTFVQNIAVVNDAGEGAMNVVQDLVMQATNKIKLQKMLVMETSFRSLVEGRRLHTRQLLSSLPLQSRYRLPLTLTSLLTRFPVRASTRRKAASISFRRGRWSRLFLTRTRSY